MLKEFHLSFNIGWLGIWFPNFKKEGRLKEFIQLLTLDATLLVQGEGLNFTADPILKWSYSHSESCGSTAVLGDELCMPQPYVINLL